MQGHQGEAAATWLHIGLRYVRSAHSANTVHVPHMRQNNGQRLCVTVPVCLLRPLRTGGDASAESSERTPDGGRRTGDDLSGSGARECGVCESELGEGETRAAGRGGDEHSDSEHGSAKLPMPDPTTGCVTVRERRLAPGCSQRCNSSWRAVGLLRASLHSAACMKLRAFADIQSGKSGSMLRICSNAMRELLCSNGGLPTSSSQASTPAAHMSTWPQIKRETARQ